MRLEPIEKPRSLLLKALYLYAKREFGKVPTPLKTIYARKPRLVAVLFVIDRLLNKGISLSPDFRLTFQAYVSLLNGCSFCHDARTAFAVQRRLGLEKFQALKDYRSSSLFDERERAALAFAEEFSQTRRVRDETFAGLAKYFTEIEIIELIWMNATETYFNSLAVPFAITSDGLRMLAEERGKKNPKKRHDNM